MTNVRRDICGGIKKLLEPVITKCYSRLTVVFDAHHALRKHETGELTSHYC